MNKLAPRIAALLLVPCLLTDPVLAAGLRSRSCGLSHVVFAGPFHILDFRSALLFNQEAVSPPFLAARMNFSSIYAAKLARMAKMRGSRPKKVRRRRSLPAAKPPAARKSLRPPRPSEYAQGISMVQFEAFIRWLEANDEVVDEQKLAVVIGRHTAGFREGCNQYSIPPVDPLRSRSVASITNKDLRKAARLLGEAGRQQNVRTVYSFFDGYGANPVRFPDPERANADSASVSMKPKQVFLPTQTSNGDSPNTESLRSIPTRTASRRKNATPETNAPDRKQQTALRNRFWAAVERFGLPAVRKHLLESHAAADEAALTGAIGAIVELHPIKNTDIFRLFSERLDDLFEGKIPPKTAANTPTNSQTTPPTSAVNPKSRNQRTNRTPFRKISRPQPPVPLDVEAELDDELVTGPEKFLGDTRRLSARVGLDVLVNMVNKSLIVDFGCEVELAELTSEVTLFLSGNPHAFGDGHSPAWDALWEVVQTAASATLRAEGILTQPQNDRPNHGLGSRINNFPQSSS